jgi:hypothetical protein
LGIYQKIKGVNYLETKSKMLITVLITIFVVTSFSVITFIETPLNSTTQENEDQISDDIEMVKIVHYAKPPGTPGGGKPPKEEPCYDLMGYKWKSTPVDYTINPSNPEGLSESFVTSVVSTSAETWDAATTIDLFSDSYSVDYNANYGTQDYNNVIEFGDHDNSNVIGVCSVWYTRRGKAIVEFDIQLNTDFEWGDATVDPTVMDVQNILVHELGHAVGLLDIYKESCNTVTMYGYSTEGETSKRSLEQPDINGLQEMYGE